MNLYAYAQIPSLEKLLEYNNIEIPRLRGLELMKDVESYNVVWSKEEKDNLAVNVVENLCRSDPFWHPHSCCSTYDSWTDYLVNYYIGREKTSDGEKEYVRWDRIHGKKKKIAKTELKNWMRDKTKQLAMYNKYVGREDVLFVHARIGGGNWPYYKDQVLGHDWFLDKVDDAWDSTYCDLYVKIDPATVERLIKEQETQPKEEEESSNDE